MFTSADVDHTLYPSIQLERGTAALRLFMDNNTCFIQTAKDLCLKLVQWYQVQFVLTINYEVCRSGVHNFTVKWSGQPWECRSLSSMP